MGIVSLVEDHFLKLPILEAPDQLLHPVLIAGLPEQSLTGDKHVHVSDKLEEDHMVGLREMETKSERGRGDSIGSNSVIAGRLGHMVGLCLMIQGTQASFHGMKTGAYVPVNCHRIYLSQLDTHTSFFLSSNQTHDIM